MTDLKRIGTGLRVVRAVRGLTQRQVAKAAKVDPSFVSLMESGDRAPSLGLVQMLLGALDVELVDLLRASEPNFVPRATKKRTSTKS